MKEYIEREAAKAYFTPAPGVEIISPITVTVESLLQTIDNIPAADVKPVVRGHYVGEADGYADGELVYDMWFCSACGCRFEDWDEKPTYNFCPNCGADMRGENNEQAKV